MRKKILISIFLVTMLIIPLQTMAMVTDKKVTTNNNQDLEVILDIKKSGNEYQIDVYLQNNGNELAEITFYNLPGGGFEIYATGVSIPVYKDPQVVIPTVSGLDLQPSEKQIIYSNMDYQKFPLLGGTYTVKGYADTSNGKIYSGSDEIKIPMAKSFQNPVFLGRFPILLRLLTPIAC